MRLGVLGIRNFRLLFLGQATSSFGDRLAPIAITFAVFDLTKSTSEAAYDLGFVFAAQTAPCSSSSLWRECGATGCRDSS